MRIPTEARLIDAFGAEPGTAAYRLLKRIDDCRQDPAVVTWAAQCYHDPRESSQAYAECLMVALDRVLGGCGVEAIRGRYVDRYHQDIQAAYINFGDTYDTTLLIDHETDRVLITSWGDWVERYSDQREVN